MNIDYARFPVNHPIVRLCPVKNFKTKALTVSSISLVWAADTQKRARDSMIGVAGKPTTTVPMFLFSISRPKALQGATTARPRWGIRENKRWCRPRWKHVPDLSRHVEHQGHDGWVVVAVDDEAHLTEPPTEVGGVLRELSQAVGPWSREEEAFRAGLDNLHEHLPEQAGHKCKRPDQSQQSKLPVYNCLLIFNICCKSFISDFALYLILLCGVWRVPWWKFPFQSDELNCILLCFRLLFFRIHLSFILFQSLTQGFRVETSATVCFISRATLLYCSGVSKDIFLFLLCSILKIYLKKNKEKIMAKRTLYYGWAFYHKQEQGWVDKNKTKKQCDETASKTKGQKKKNREKKREREIE